MIKGSTYAALTLAAAGGCAWVVDRTAALLCDYPPLNTPDYPNELVASYLLTPSWDERGSLFALIAAGVVLLISLTNFTNRRQKALEKEVKGREYGGARFATEDEIKPFAHLSTTRTVPPKKFDRHRAKLAARVRERVALSLKNPISSVKAALNMPITVTSPKPEWCEKLEDDNILLSKGAMLQHSRIEDGIVERNKHVLVIGGSGSRKTWGFVIPNVLQLYGSYVISDIKGEVSKSCAPFLRKHGYRVLILDLKSEELSLSMRYNPLLYVKSVSQIISFVDMLMANTTGEGGAINGSTDYFQKAERGVYYTAFGFTLFFYEDYPQYRTLQTAIDLIHGAAEGGSQGPSALDRIILGAEGSSFMSFRERLIDKYGSEDEARNSDEWFVIRQYLGFKATAKAPETEAGVISSCNVRLAPFSEPDIIRLFSDDEMHLERIGQEKTALFLVSPDSDRSRNVILTMLLHQLFEINAAIADRSPSGHLKYPVTCLLDELANVGKIPDLDTKIATFRSRWINICPILQNYGQLDKFYKDTAETIVANCDTTLFLGHVTDEKTNERVSKRLGKRTVPVRTESVTKGSTGSYTVQTSWKEMDLISATDLANNPEVFGALDCLVFINNAWPIKDVKYDVTSHPRYHELQECGLLDMEEFGASLERRRAASATSGLERSVEPRADGSVALIAQVGYRGFETGQSYRAEVALVHVNPKMGDEREVLDAAGNQVVASLEFVAGSPDGAVGIPMPPIPPLEGRTVLARGKIVDEAGDTWATMRAEDCSEGIRFPLIVRREFHDLPAPTMSLGEDKKSITCSWPTDSLEIPERTYLLCASLEAHGRDGRGVGPVGKEKVVVFSPPADGGTVEVTFDIDPASLANTDFVAKGRACMGGTYIREDEPGGKRSVVDVTRLENLAPGSPYLLTTTVVRTDRPGGQGVVRRVTRLIPSACSTSVQVVSEVEVDEAEPGRLAAVHQLELEGIPVSDPSSMGLDVPDCSLHVPWDWRQGAVVSGSACEYTGEKLVVDVSSLTSAPGLSSISLEIHARNVDGTDLGVLVGRDGEPCQTVIDVGPESSPAVAVPFGLDLAPYCGLTLTCHMGFMRRAVVAKEDASSPDLVARLPDAVKERAPSSMGLDSSSVLKQRAPSREKRLKQTSQS